MNEKIGKMTGKGTRLSHYKCRKRDWEGRGLLYSCKSRNGDWKWIWKWLGCPRKSREGLEEESWLHRCTRRKGDRKGKMTVFL
jgi:hypothetical protein